MADCPTEFKRVAANFFGLEPYNFFFGAKNWHSLHCLVDIAEWLERSEPIFPNIVIRTLYGPKITQK